MSRATDHIDAAMSAVDRGLGASVNEMLSEDGPYDPDHDERQTDRFFFSPGEAPFLSGLLLRHQIDRHQAELEAQFWGLTSYIFGIPLLPNDDAQRIQAWFDAETRSRLAESGRRIIMESVYRDEFNELQRRWMLRGEISLREEPFHGTLTEITDA